jgi:hypothetical protein
MSDTCDDWLSERVLVGDEHLEEFAEAMEKVEDVLPTRIAADPEKVEQGLAKLVLTLIELIRRLLEKQALRRMESGSLTDEEIERLGQTFIKLDEKMKELKSVFGLDGEELNLNLGPLGDLM